MRRRRCARHQTLVSRRSKPKVDFAAVMARVKQVVTEIEPHDSVERYTALGVDVVPGHARLIDPWTVEIDGRTRLTAPSIVIATGARPFVPAIPGLDTVNVLTSDTVWQLREALRRLLVLGGGPIGCELSQAFCAPGRAGHAGRDGTAPDGPRGRRGLRPRASQPGARRRAGAVRPPALRAERVGEVQRLWVGHADAEQAIEFDAVLVAVGRQARVTGFGLEELGVPLTQRGTIEVNAQLQSTKFPNLYAVGDVAGLISSRTPPRTWLGMRR